MLVGLVWSTFRGMASLVFNVPMAQTTKGADEAPQQAGKSTHKDVRAAPKMVYLGIPSESPAHRSSSGDSLTKMQCSIA